MLTPIIQRVHPLRCYRCGSSLVSDLAVCIHEDEVLYRQRCGGCSATQEAALDPGEVLGDICPICGNEDLTFKGGTVREDGWRLQHACGSCGAVISNCAKRFCPECVYPCLRKGPARESSSEMSIEMTEMLLC